MRSRVTIVWLALAGLLMFAFLTAKVPHNTSKEVPISALIDSVEKGDISRVTIEDNRIVAVLKQQKPDEAQELTSYASDKTELVRALRDKKVPYDEVRPSSLGPILLSLLPIALIILFIILLMRSLKNASGGGAAKQFGSSKAKLHHGSTSTFDDVAGVDEAVNKARELVTFLKNPTKYAKIGAEMPKGYLFVGPSGTGKTLLARAVAGEAKVPFFSISGSDFVEMFVGVGASRVRDLFGQAKKHAPCIIFIDEIDAVAKRRGGLSSGGNDEREQTLNAILTEMDGFEPNDGVIIIAATNRPEVLDKAALRPGRFSRHIVVPAPDINGRVKVLEVHGKKLRLAPDIDLRKIAQGTSGMTGADLKNVLNEGAILAANADKEYVELSDIFAARDTVIAGEERRGAVISPSEKRIIAVHESGHTIIGWFNPDCDPVHRVTIVARGMSLGSTWHLPEEDQHLRSKKQFMASIMGLYGGRLAEDIVLGDVTTGASNDIQRLTDIAKAMVEDYGMGDQSKLGPPRMYGDKESGMVFEHSVQDYSEGTKREIDAQVRAILQVCYDRAKQVITEKRELLDALTEALIEKETLEQDELTALLGPQVKIGDAIPA